jgi:hypothetical protein
MMRVGQSMMRVMAEVGAGRLMMMMMMMGSYTRAHRNRWRLTESRAAVQQGQDHPDDRKDSTGSHRNVPRSTEMEENSATHQYRRVRAAQQRPGQPYTGPT